jgi:hypothetical protein
MMAGLEAWYHRLLRAYPKRYRADRGPEMLTTLLDGARPGQTRPTWQEAKDLLLGGLRYRLRMPRRSLVGFAAFIALAAATFGAAIGASLGWIAAPPVPAEVRGGLVVDEAVRDSGVHVFGSDIRIESGNRTYLPDWSSATVRTDRPDALVAATRDSLSAAGWRIEPRQPGFEATKRDVTLRVAHGSDGTEFTIDRGGPALVWILGLAGALLAALAAWLLTGFAARRALAASSSIQSTVIVFAVLGNVAMLVGQLNYVMSAVHEGHLPALPMPLSGTILWFLPVMSWVVGLGALLMALLVAGASPPPASRYASGSTNTIAKR